MDDQERTLYCGNLSPDINEEILFELFLQAGPLERVKIPKERDGRFRSYAFVTFKHEVSVPYAITLLSGTKLHGRHLRLQSRSGNGSGEGSGDRFNRSLSLPDARAAEGPMSSNNFQRNNSTARLSFNHGYHDNKDAFGRSPEVEEVSVNVRGAVNEMNDLRNVNRLSHKPCVINNSNNGTSSSYQGNVQLPLGSWQNGAMLSPLWVQNGPQGVVDTSTIFDPVIDQKMRERLILLQQQDQVKRVQQFMQSQRLGPYHPCHRSESQPWWQ